MNRNCRRKTEKIYVKVNSDFDATGYMQPRQITWGDGRTYPIEQVRDFALQIPLPICPATVIL